MQEIREYVRLKNDTDSQNITIEEPCFVFLTAFMTHSFRNHLTALGVRHIYEKPVSKELLLSVLESIWSRNGSIQTTVNWHLKSIENQPKIYSHRLILQLMKKNVLRIYQSKSNFIFISSYTCKYQFSTFVY